VKREVVVVVVEEEEEEETLPALRMPVNHTITYTAVFFKVINQ